MKKKVLSAISLSLVCTMMAASLTGCGTKAEATDNIIVGEENLDSEETIVVSDVENNETIDNEVIEEEAASNVESTEVEGATIATDADVVFYDKTGYSEYDFTDVDYEDAAKTVTFEQNTSVYSDEGVEIGYIKGGSTINITEHMINSRWYRFENPVNGTDYDYLYVIDNDIPVEPVLTQDDILNALNTNFSNKDMSYELLNAPASDMEKVEFSVSKTETIADFIVASYLYPELHLDRYTKFYIEADGEDDENYNFIIYYKDLYQAE